MTKLLCDAILDFGDEKVNNPKKLIYFSVVVSALSGAACLAAYMRFGGDLLYSLTVTAFAFLYHIVMRLFVAVFVTAVRSGRSDDFSFVLGRCERNFYDTIRLKSWKSRVPTYDPSLFEVRRDALPTLVHNMRNAEVGHSVIAALSFLPMFFSPVFGGFAAFAVTSVLSALFDLQFVAVQRYNRARVCKTVRMRAERQ